MKLEKPEAIIFDMDGVLIDSEGAWYDSEGSFLMEIAPKYSKVHHDQIIGIRLKDLHQLMCDQFGATISFKEFCQHYEKMGQTIYAKRTQLLPDVRETLIELRRRNVPLGLASSSPHTWIRIALERFELQEFFTAVVSGDDVPNGKPAPDVYLEAVRALGKMPKRCWAVEDAGVGLQAAHRAELFTIGLRNGQNDDQPFDEADLTITSLTSLIDLLT